MQDHWVVSYHEYRSCSHHKSDHHRRIASDDNHSFTGLNSSINDFTLQQPDYNLDDKLILHIFGHRHHDDLYPYQQRQYDHLIHGSAQHLDSRTHAVWNRF